MQLREYAALDEADRRKLEDARARILDLVSALERERDPPVLRESLTFEFEPLAENRKAQIHELEVRIRRGEIPPDRLVAGRDSLDWGLDRIAFYVAYGAGLLAEVPLADVVTALKREEEQARTRNLVVALQPLYYALECIDERLVAPVAPPVASRLSSIADSIDNFIAAHTGRDTGGHIRGRLTSIRRKL
jgi:hypothetical protein